MHSERTFLLSAVAVLVFTVSVVQAADSIPVAQLKTMVRDSNGTRVLVVSGTALENNDWLGVSLYQPNCQDAIWEAQHSAYAMPKGDFTRSLAIPGELEGGTFEVALWQKKVAQHPVFRMAAMRGYGSGSMKDGGYDYPANDTISALKTSLETLESKLTLKISGAVRDSENWLGISFYRANYADPVVDADHTVRRVKLGNFIETIRVPEGFETGTYEAALWKNQLERKDIYKFDKLLGYATGRSVKP